jgi:uncharacterized protein YqfA (UPF0365 family)
LALLLLVATIVIVIITVLFFAFGRLWLQAMTSGCALTVGDILGMYLRRIRPQTIIDALIMAHKAGVPVELDQLQAHALARGDVKAVVEALIAASSADIPLSFEEAAAMDLAGRDVRSEVQSKAGVSFVGRTGIAQTAIHPPGKMILETGGFLDVVSEGELIGKRTRIVVVKGAGGVYTVKEAPE